MMCPPSLARIRVVKRGRTKVSLWLPLILIWPPVLLAGILLSPVILVVALVLWPSGKGRVVLLAGPLGFYVFCALRGSRLDVRSARETVQVYFW